MNIKKIWALLALFTLTTNIKTSNNDTYQKGRKQLFTAIKKNNLQDFLKQSKDLI